VFPLWIDPRRLLLFGKPQIGKTGAYFHFAWRLAQVLDCGRRPAPPPPTPPPEDAHVFPNFPTGMSRAWHVLLHLVCLVSP
jgi:hypothetical protein